MDNKILSRIKEKLESEYDVVCPQEYRMTAGMPRPQLAEFFGDDCLYVFWIATHEMSKYGKYLQHDINLLQHKSIYDGFPEFITLFPREVVDNPPALPSSLAMYTPLLEDEHFMNRVKSTCNLQTKTLKKDCTE